MTTKEVADRLVALCRAGRNVEAVETLLSPAVVSVEAIGHQTMPAVMTGREAVRGKNEWWVANHKIHRTSVQGPYPNGDRFAVIFDFEVTPKVGATAGKRMRMQEVALYTVADGAVVREEFFYDMSGGGEPTAAKPRAKKAKPAHKTTRRAKAKSGTKGKAARKARSRR